MDHISNLPDELRGRILSFLTTKEAARTACLSKSWRYMMAFVPNLTIDDSEFLQPEEGKQDRPEMTESFMSFVDRTLSLQNSVPVEKVSIKCSSAVDTDRVDGWILNVLARNVSSLDVQVGIDDDDDGIDDDDDGIDDDDDGLENYKLSPTCFKSKTLVELKVDCGVEINWSGGTTDSKLKTLMIEDATVENFETLVHALPALEDLIVVDVNWTDSVVNISSVSLKYLKISSNENLDSVSLDTPSVVFFYYSDFVAKDYPLVKMDNLVDAQLHLLVTQNEINRVRAPDVFEFFGLDMNDDPILLFPNVGKLINGIRNVKYLDLGPDTLEVLSLCCESMPVFNNLKFLHIKSDKKRGWQAMPVLLRSCPRLEILVLEGLLHHETDKCGDACDCVIREDKGLSLASCSVKKLGIQGFLGTMKEMGMIKHFLECFQCLKKMEIFVEQNAPTALSVPEVAILIPQMIREYNNLSSCHVQLL